MKAEDLDRIRAGFDRMGITEASLIGCSTFGGDRGAVVSYRNTRMKLDGSPRFLLRVCVAPSQLAAAAEIIRGESVTSGVRTITVHEVTQFRAKC